MIKSIGTKLVPLTADLAKEFSVMESTAGERTLKPWRVEFLRSRYDVGLFHTPKWATAFCAGKKYRVNGHHSSVMLAELNGAFPKGMKVVIDEFACDNAQELAELFQQFDPAASVRARGEVIAAHARAEPALAEVGVSAVRRAVDGIAFHVEATAETRLGKDDRARLCHTHQDFILWYSPFCYAKAMSLVSVVGAMYASFLKDQAAATEFWTLANDESHPDVAHPSRTLSRWLRDPERTGTKRKGKTVETPRTMYDKCIHAWNAYRSGRPLTHLSAFRDKKGGVAKAV